MQLLVINEWAQWRKRWQGEASACRLSQPRIHSAVDVAITLIHPDRHHGHHHYDHHHCHHIITHIHQFNSKRYVHLISSKWSPYFPKTSITAISCEEQCCPTANYLSEAIIRTKSSFMATVPHLSISHSQEK